MGQGEKASAGALLTEGVVGKFLRYVRIDSQADPRAETVPSSPGQWEMARLLAAEAEAMGLQEVSLDAHGIVMATLPARGGSAGQPTVALLAHVDTSPAVSARGVRPVLHRQYAGGLIPLPAGPVLDPAQYPALREAVGHDVITSDGSTLLGADDKAGVAEIMAAAAYLLQHPEVPCPRLRLCFTVDEEIGRGVEHLDLGRLGADVAYTVDGGVLGEISGENFNAANVRLRLRGRSAHTGSARGQMVNAVELAAALVAMTPGGMRPETTDGRQGFIHFDQIRGDVEQVELTVLLRDFESDGLEAKRRWLHAACTALVAGHPGATWSVEEFGGYRNMRDGLGRWPEVLRRAERAMQRAGVAPRPTPIRGGTDGARLTEQGLPTPNLFTGGDGFHSRTEWVCCTWMQRAVDTLVELARLWAEPAGA